MTLKTYKAFALNTMFWNPNLCRFFRRYWSLTISISSVSDFSYNLRIRSSVFSIIDVPRCQVFVDFCQSWWFLSIFVDNYSSIFAFFLDLYQFCRFSTILLIVDDFVDFRRFCRLSTILLIVDNFVYFRQFCRFSTILSIFNNFVDFRQFCRFRHFYWVFDEFWLLWFLARANRES